MSKRGRLANASANSVTVAPAGVTAADPARDPGRRLDAQLDHYAVRIK